MVSEEESRRRAIAAVQAVFDRYHVIAKKRPSDHRDFDHEVMKNTRILDAGPKGTVLYELHISPNFSNLNDVMHGGAAGVIFDMLTTTAMAPLQKPGYWTFMAGVTRTLNISYLRAVPINTTVRVRSWVVQAGKTMAMIRGEMTSIDGSIVYSVAEHHKVNVPTRPEHLEVRIPWDDEVEEIWRQEDEENKKKSKGRSKL